MSKPCVFFDRDGIVNEPPPDEVRYVLRKEDLHIIPSFLQALRVARDHGYEVVIVTNQKGVSTGRLSAEDLQEIHDHLLDLVRSTGLDITDIYISPHGDDAHPDRKPNPGMLLRAAKDHNLDLSRSWMIGDNEKDVLAGRGAGCFKTIRVKSGPLETLADHHLESMQELPAFLEEHL